MITWTRQQIFQFVHSNNLIYNQCWEDPRLDHQALDIKPSDNVLVITSAGCNALDYLLKSPQRVDAVDMNPRQNALLELKIAALNGLDFPDFFALFGLGKHENAEKLYAQTMRPQLSTFAKSYWDKHISFFSPSGWRPTFYYRGSSGFLARLMTYYVSLQGMKEALEQAFAAQTLNEQKDIYYSYLKPRFWNEFLRWTSRRAATMSALGVPRSQFVQIEQHYKGGMAKFIEDCLENVFARLPLKDNYFWHLYLFGSYTKNCSPNYLKEENFAHLKNNSHKVATHTTSLLDFLKDGSYNLHKVSLLDHMDWLYQKQSAILREQWQMLLERSTPATKIIWRSASLKVDFVDSLPVKVKNQWGYVGDHLNYDYNTAQTLHAQDRVHTYGSFYIAKVNR